MPVTNIPPKVILVYRGFTPVDLGVADAEYAPDIGTNCRIYYRSLRSDSFGECEKADPRNTKDWGPWVRGEYLDFGELPFDYEPDRDPFNEG